MDSLGILDLVIGLFFIYFVFSVICTAIVEGIAQLWEWRSAHLNKWIMDTFLDTLGKGLLDHGLIKGLTQTGRKADYIPANLFASALLDLINKERVGDVKPYDFNQLQQAVEHSKLLPADLKQFLLQALHDSQNHGGSLAMVHQRLEAWYEDAMERLIGTYKKRARFVTWLVAIAVAFGANADTIALSKYLKDNPKTTEALVLAATQATQDSALYRQTVVRLDSISAKLSRDTALSAVDSALFRNTLKYLEISKIQSDSLYRALRAMGLPLGWDQARFSMAPCDPASCSCSKFWCDVKRFTLKFIGLLLTALALTLGAPFWFDMINKLVNIRSSGRRPEEMRDNNKNTPVG